MVQLIQQLPMTSARGTPERNKIKNKREKLISKIQNNESIEKLEKYEKALLLKTDVIPSIINQKSR